MPRNIRNFWIRLNIDGRQSVIESGPVSKNGGFSMEILMRDKKGITTPVRIVGQATEDGSLTLILGDADGKPFKTIQTKR